MRAALQISKQRLSQQRNIKRKQYQTPITSIPKEKVVADRLESFVVMPEQHDCAFSKWWETIPADHDVNVRYPYERHGNAGKVSHNAKTQVPDDFLQFVDSQMVLVQIHMVQHTSSCLNSLLSECHLVEQRTMTKR